MRKKLIAAIIAVLFLIAAAVGVIVYMENKPGESANPGNAVTESNGEETVETTEETVGISLATENPDEAAPEDTFGEEDIAPPVTGSTGETEGPDANETPEDEF